MTNVCVDAIKQAGEGRLGDREAAELLRDLGRRTRRIRQEQQGLSADEALAQANSEYVRSLELAALAKKRNVYLGRMKRLEGVDMIRNSFAGKYGDGLKALLVGTQGGQAGSRRAAGIEINTLRDYYLGGLIADVNRVEGGIEIIQKGLLQREVANALWALNTPGATLDGMDVRAVGLAKAIHKYQELARTDANKAGAWIGKLEGYIVRQSHDPMRVSQDYGAWRAKILERADIPRMLREADTDDVEELLTSIWEALSSGIHMKSKGAEPGGKGLRGMAKKLSQERVIHFKSADDWLDYNENFGVGSVYDAAVQGLQNSARATGLMRVLGPNHESTYDGIVQDLVAEVRSRDPRAADALKKESETLKNWYMGQLDGSATIPGNDLLTTALQVTRGVQTMSSLGASLLASVADTGIIAVGAKYNGVNALGMIGEGLGNFTRLAKTQDELDALADLGVAMETMANMIVNDRFGVDSDVRGMIGYLQQKFFTMNLQNRWTDAQRTAIAMGLSSNLARRVGSTFDQLPEELRKTFAQYGIDAGMWDIVRKGTLREVEGRTLLTPSALKDVPDEEFAAYLKAKGQPSKPRDIERLRLEMDRKVRGYFVDQRGYMFLTPDAAVTGAMTIGLKANTAAGQIVRTIMQFKSFAFAFSNRIIGREYKQHGWAGIAKMLVLTTMAGYAAMTLKDLAKGRKPRDPSDGGTWLAAAAQGGGLGIYGDLLMSQVFDRRRNAAVALLGPTASDIDAALDVASRAAEGKDPGAAGVRLVQSNLPFMNLFYTKLMMDYLVFWNMQEAVNPGSLQRMESELNKNTGQEMWISPARSRFPNAPEIQQ